MSSAAGTSTVSAKRAKHGDKAHCCVPQCTNDARYDRSLSFHRFPKNEKLRKRWIINIKRDPGRDFKITGNTRVCSDHFVSDDFKFRSLFMPGSRRFLKEGSIPTVFAWSLNKKSPRRQIVKHYTRASHNVEAPIRTRQGRTVNTPRYLQENYQLSKLTTGHQKKTNNQAVTQSQIVPTEIELLKKELELSWKKLDHLTAELMEVKTAAASEKASK